MSKRQILLLLLMYAPALLVAQCLTSVNPVGGTDNLLVLEKNTLRVITFYKYGQGDRYFEGTEPSAFDLISKASYNYLAAVVGYGITPKLTLELESGYFFNKTQKYNLDPPYDLTGRGLSNAVILAKRTLLTDHFHRIYITGSAGVKIPYSRTMQWSAGHVRLPVEVQPTLGAYGAVAAVSFVKENSGTGMRYFVTSRLETHAPNREEYRPGTLLFSSFYISKHLRRPWLKDHWTAILQLRHEIRTRDAVEGIPRESSGSTLLFLAPQLNYVLGEWYLSGMVDIPVWQNFNGTQLGAGMGYTFIVARTFPL